MAENERLIDLIDAVDIIIPEAYSFTDNKLKWFRYLRAAYDESQRWNKPCLFFVCPRATYNNSDLNYSDFMFVLDSVKSIGADGVVLWGGWDYIGNTVLPWDNNAEWLKAAKDFAIKIERHR
jgi:hypothetical protein